MKSKKPTISPQADKYADYPAKEKWSVEDIPYQDLARDHIKDDIQLLYMMASASFIEITSDLYTRNLVDFFGNDQETTDWLKNNWEPEELQHGVALKRYVQAAWPEFDWDAAYRAFFDEYSKTCSMEELEPTRALELVARCVVETGTASFYTMLADADREPVLTMIASHIRSDEIRHYKYFYRYFQKYCQHDRPGRIAVLKTLLKRAAAVQSEDALIAFKHVYLACNAEATFKKSAYDSYRESIRLLAKHHFPQEMAVKMILKPLSINATLGRFITPMAVSSCGIYLRQ